ncbi:hypothetical protein ACFFRR_001584 [Megaselia abdita]
METEIQKFKTTWFECPKADPDSSPDSTIGNQIHKSMSSNPYLICQESDTEDCSMSNNSALFNSIFIRNFIQKNNMKNGDDVIVVLSENLTSILPIVLACLFENIPINPVSTSYSPEEFAHVLRITKPTVVFCEGNRIQMIQEILSDENISSRIISLIDHKPYLLVDNLSKIYGFNYRLKEPFFFSAPVEGKEQPAAIICTAGFKDLPKPVNITHSSVQSFQTETQPDDVILCFSNLSTLTGLTSLLQSILNNSKRIITQKPFDEEYLLDIVEDYHVTRIYTTVAEFTRVANANSLPKRNLKSIRSVIVGGAYICSELILRLQKFLPNGVITINYTITEFEGVAVQNPDAQLNPRSVGKPLNNTFVKVIDALGHDLGSEKTGEICLKRTDKTFGGYYNNPEDTASVIDGWLVTGDIGYYDNDGFLYIVGRKEEIYSYNESIFYPSQIEERIYRLPSVKEVCVVGLKESEECYVPAAVIVKKEKSTLTELEVIMEVLKDMDDSNKLRGGVYFVDGIPKNRNGACCRRTVASLLVKND